jgi:hypothetical protein
LFRENAVKKPWGFEYLAFESEEVALWVLHLTKGMSTSMHAHPSKTTGLVLLSGIVELSFIADSKILAAPNKQMIRRGLFHQTKALTEGVVLLEVETPNDKGDLVRLFDRHGREAMGYETSDQYFARDGSHAWIEPDIGKHAKVLPELPGSVRVRSIEKLSDFEELPDSAIVMFLQGGVGKTVDGRKHLATVAGDVAVLDVLKIVLQSMEFVAPKTLILEVS